MYPSRFFETSRFHCRTKKPPGANLHLSASPVRTGPSASSLLPALSPSYASSRKILFVVQISLSLSLLPSPESSSKLPRGYSAQRARGKDIPGTSENVEILLIV